MARPQKDGLDYFPFDVDFYEDEKIEALSGNFGLKGEAIVIRLLCLIYRNGYWAPVNDLTIGKLVNNVRNTTPDLVKLVIKHLTDWGFFDKALYEKMKILTSKGIQKRYFEAVSRRTNINYSNLPYLLIDIDTKKERQQELKSVNVDINPHSTGINVNINAERKVKESKEEEHAAHGGNSVFFTESGEVIPEGHYQAMIENLKAVSASGVNVKFPNRNCEFVLPNALQPAYCKILTDFGLDGILEAIEKLKVSGFWKRKKEIAFSTFLKPDTIIGLLEDKYRDDFSQKPGGYGKPQSGKPNSRRSRADYTEAELAAMTAEEKCDAGIANDAEKDEYNRQQEEKYKLWKSTLPQKGTEK